MKELIQAGDFYDSLTRREQLALIDAIAEDIMFLDEKLQIRVAELLETVKVGLGHEIAHRNNFTI